MRLEGARLLARHFVRERAPQALAARSISLRPAHASVKLDQGFCASTGDAIMLFAATYLGIPVPTTHSATGSVIE